MDLEEHDYEHLDPRLRRFSSVGGGGSHNSGGDRSWRSKSDHHLDRAAFDRDRRRSIPPRRPDSAPREGYGGRPRGGGRSETRAEQGFHKKRSQSLGDRMALAVCHPQPSPQAQAGNNLLLYHVSKPEPRGE